MIQYLSFTMQDLLALFAKSTFLVIPCWSSGQSSGTGKKDALLKLRHKCYGIQNKTTTLFFFHPQKQEVVALTYHLLKKGT